MKHALFTLLLTGFTLSLAEQVETSQKNEAVNQAIQRVEDARVNTISALQKMISTVEKARATSTSTDIGIATQIIETHALSEIAKSTAHVETTKARSISLITQAIDKLDTHSLGIIADSIAAVEIAKAQATEKIIEVTQRVELSKTTPSTQLKYPNETLTIAKNLAAIQIAKAVAATEMEKAISSVEVVKYSTGFEEEDVTSNDTKNNQDALEYLKAKSTANISSYLAQIEVVKANMIAKIAKEIANVEIAKLKNPNISVSENTTYPKKLIKVN